MQYVQFFLNILQIGQILFSLNGKIELMNKYGNLTSSQLGHPCYFAVFFISPSSFADFFNSLSTPNSDLQTTLLLYWKLIEVICHCHIDPLNLARGRVNMKCSSGCELRDELTPTSMRQFIDTPFTSSSALKSVTVVMSNDGTKNILSDALSGIDLSPWDIGC